MFKILDLFSGIGSFSLGLEKSGFGTTKMFCEIDEACHKVLKKHWKDVPIHFDIKTLTKEIAGDIDVICGGFPCTDISVAGKQKGLIDENGNITRSGLWFEMLRLIRECQPRYVILENVANIRNKGLVTVLQNLSEIGYSSEWSILSARDFGASHLRERIFIIAYPNTYSNRLQKNPHDGLLFGERYSKFFNLCVPKLSVWNKPPPSFTEFCGMDVQLPEGFHKGRLRDRIKQLGNTIVPIIPEFIGYCIMEGDKEWIK